MHYNNTGKINSIYLISIIVFIVLMNREISKITIMIIMIIYSDCLFYFEMNNNIGSIIIITLINTTIAIVALIYIYIYIYIYYKLIFIVTNNTLI